jgi:hypothetical protein
MAFLRVTPGLFAPTLLLSVCIAWFVHAAQVYYALPLAERTADGDPFSANADMFFAGMAILVALLLFVPPLLAGLPSRLRTWQAVLALGLQALPLAVAVMFADTTLGLLALVGLAYVPALVVVRLVLRHPIGPIPEGGS